MHPSNATIGRFTTYNAGVAWAALVSVSQSWQPAVRINHAWSLCGEAYRIGVCNRRVTTTSLWCDFCMSIVIVGCTEDAVPPRPSVHVAVGASGVRDMQKCVTCSNAGWLEAVRDLGVQVGRHICGHVDFWQQQD